MTNSTSLRRMRWPWIPSAAVAIFLCFYMVAGWLYPGGTKFDPGRMGFSMVDNYWCDLLDEPTYGGHQNPARPVALVGILILCTGLMVFWWRAPLLFPDSASKGWVVRITGIGSGATLPLVATPQHDLAINIAGILGFIALGISLNVLKKRRETLPMLLGQGTLVFSLLNFLSWQTGIGLLWLPLLQKIAFAVFLLWVVVISRSFSSVDS